MSKTSDFLHSFSEGEQARTVYEIVKVLCEKNLVSHDPHNILISRVGRGPIFPCRKSKRTDVLNLSQLEWAAKNGHFWFLGPIKSLEIGLELGTQKVTLVHPLVDTEILL